MTIPRFDVALSEKSNPTIRVDGTSVNGVALAASSTVFAEATVLARKPVTDADKATVANTGTIWLSRSATSITGATPLTPGQSVQLPSGGDLADWFLIVETANDGVSITIKK